MDIFYLMHHDNKIAAFTVDNGSILSFKLTKAGRESCLMA